MSRASRVRAVLWAVLLVGLGALLWHKAVRPHVIPKNFGVVVPGRIYRSGELTPAAMRRVVNEHGVRTIVDLGTFPPGSPGERREQYTAAALNVERYRLELSGDATGNPNYYVDALRLMTDPAKQPLLVHCGAGSERTSCAVILYRHAVEGRPVDAVFHEALEHRHNPKRNPRLRQVLAEWAGPITRAFKGGTAIPGVEGTPEPRPIAPPAPP